MSRHPSTHVRRMRPRLPTVKSIASLGSAPRAGQDPIDNELTALSLFGLAISTPLCPETIVVPLDETGIGQSIICVDGTVDDDSIIRVIEMVALACGEHEFHRLIAATVRPGRGLADDDDQRWMEASWTAETYGCELIEWYVIGNGVWLPREALGECERWPV